MLNAELISYVARLLLLCYDNQSEMSVAATWHVESDMSFPVLLENTADR